MKNNNFKNFNSVSLTGSFMEKYMPYVSAQFICVYLCIKAIESEKEILVDDVATCLRVDPKDVSEAVLYWQLQGLLKEKDGRIILTPIKDKAPAKVHFDEPPQYQPAELSLYAQKNSEIRQLFDLSQRYLGRLLTHNDLSCIFSLHHWLGLSVEVIDKLLQYCTENNHRNMRYIERVAVDWAEAGITTPEMVDERIRLYNTEFRQIMRAFGQSGRSPAPSEEKFMKKWIGDYNFNIDIIVIACEKTVHNTGKTAFGYADKILARWKDAGVKYKEDIEQLELKFASAQQEKAANDKKAGWVQKPAAKNKFADYEQRTYDYETFEENERNHAKGSEK